MFKPKKYNENAIKKDFFAKKKKPKTIEYFSHGEENKRQFFFDVDELNKISIPEKNQMFFIRSKKARPITDLIPKSATDIFIFCSRIKEKFIEDLKPEIKGIVMSQKIFEQEFCWAKNYNPKKSSNHSKMIAFKFKSEKYVIFGSGNPSINARNEIYVFHKSGILFDKLIKCFHDVQEN